jgi:cyclophilin family peptidyl-prolyl cis-trans isomerase
LEQIVKENPKDVRLVYRHFPLKSIHNKADLAARAAEAAGMQGKFWEMHDLLFANQNTWADQAMTIDQFTTWLLDQAGKLELDKARFTADLNSEALVKLANDAWENGQKIGLPGTPSIIVNGRIYQGPLSYANLDQVVKVSLLEKRQFSECPPMTIDPSKQYVAKVLTDKGEITIELFADKAPMAVNSFIFLAKNHWFDGVTFHRVLPGFVAQTGDPSGTGMGNPGYAFGVEASDLKYDQPGRVGMANAGPGTNGSQFFITFGPAANLDGGYTIFGQVVQGMDVAAKLTARDPAKNPNLPPGDKVTTVVIEEK